MPGNGPPPKPEGQRRRTNATVAMTKLPAGGRTEPAPPWPLDAAVSEEVKLERLNRQIDEQALLANSEDQPTAKAAERKLWKLREAAEILSAEITLYNERESQMWTELWATPQAVAWERLGWHRIVAQFVRWQIRAEQCDKDAAQEARQLSDRLGLTPMALLRLRWEISEDEVGKARVEQTTSGGAKRRRSLKAVDDTG